MPTKTYPPKIRLLRDKYPYVKGTEFILISNEGLVLKNDNTLHEKPGYYMSDIKVFSFKESENTDWFEPVNQEEAPVAMDTLLVLIDTTLKGLEQGVNQLKGFKAQGWQVVKERMKKIIEEDEKKI